MKIFTNKSIWKKIAIALVIIISFEAIITHPVQASVLEAGGKLIKPFFSLLVTVGDGVMAILHSSIMNIDASLIEVDNTSTVWKTIKAVFAVALTIACVVGACIASGGLATICTAGAILSVASTAFLGSNFFVKLENEAGHAVMSVFGKESLPSKLYLPAYSYSPEEIFKGNILLFNVNFFRKPIEIKTKRSEINTGDGLAGSINEELNEKINKEIEEIQEQIRKNGEDSEKLARLEELKKRKEQTYTVDYYYYEDEDGEVLEKNEAGEVILKGYKTSKQDSATFLQGTVSSWYNAIRNICIVLMLSVLVYIGIRILLSSVASDKAKYQTMLKDWFVGLCLLFLMHYIMAFSVTLVEKLTDVISSSLDNNIYTALIPHTNLIEDSLDELDIEKKLRIDENNAKQGYGWPTNLMGYLRVKAQMSSPGWQYIGEAIMFLILVGFTAMFTFTYLKRLLYMAFLTILAPLVAFTYCIDKLNDGQAQGFNKWLKEYIFNLLIQPMHLLLYYILVTSSFQFMGENLLYSIVAIGFMLPAEKLLRSLFGFEKAHTPPALGPAGAMMASSVLTSLLHKRAGGKGEGGNSKGDDDPEKPPYFDKEFNPMEQFPDEERGEPFNQSNNTQGSTNTDSEQSGNGGENSNKPNGLGGANGANNVGGNTNSDSSSQNNGTNTSSQAMGAGGFKQPNRAMNTYQHQSAKKRKIRRRLHALGAVGLEMGRRTLKGLPGKSIRMAGRLAVGGVLGSMAAGAGIAIGAMTGDPTNVVKMGVGSAMSGFAMGSSAIENAHIKSEYKEAYKQAMNSSEYKEEAMADYVKKYKKDIKNLSYFEQKLGYKEARKMYKSGEIEAFLSNGITDKSEMKALHKFINTGVSVDDAIAISKLANMIGAEPESMSTKKETEWKTTITNLAKNSGIKDPDKFTENRWKQIQELYDLKK